MKREAVFFRIGEFSLINDAVFSGLNSTFGDLEWRVVDVERDIINRDPALRMRAVAGAMLRYGNSIVMNRQPPRDFYPRLPVAIDGLRKWVLTHIDPANTALIFQTQSLFDARHPEVPHFVYTDHTYLANRRYPEPKPLLPVAEAWRQMERDLYARANCTFVSSGFAADSLREDYGVSDGRVEIVFSGSNVAPGEPGVRTGKVILFVGVDWERKGGPELMTAFREVRAAVPEAELWIVGCSPVVRDAGVRVLGRLPAKGVAECYREADVFCLPSRMDPSASVLAEAASYGLPVVATRVGGNFERVQHGVTGFLCEPSELAGRLVQLLQSPEMRRELGDAGRKLVSERFTWESVCGRMTDRMRKEIGQ